MASEPGARPIPLRTAAVGLVFSVIVSLWGQYAAAQMNYNYLTFPQMPLCLMLPFLLFIVAPNLVLRAWTPARALTLPDMTVIFCMGLIAATVPNWGMVRYLVSLIVAPHYFASPENQWATRFFDYLPEWLVVQNDKGAVSDFFAGLPASRAMPWRAWITPLFWWLSVFGALLFVGACLVVILRKQWIEHERLRFPMGEVVVRLMETPEGSGRPRLFSNRMFQTGCFVTLGIMAWNCAAFWEVLPRIPIPGAPLSLIIDPAFPAINIRLNPYVLCFAFFVNVEILFSVWFFQLFGILESGILNRLGVFSPASTVVPGGLVSIQFSGGLIMFVLWGLWMSRRHLRAVVRHALGRNAGLEDDHELFSYRTAVFGAAAGFAYLVFWLHAIGLPLSNAVLFLFFLFVFYLGIARVLAEAGLINLDLPINAHAFTVGMLGSAQMTGAALTGLGLTNAFARNWRTFSMVGLSHVAWFHDRLRLSRRHLFRWVCLAFGASTATSLGYVIYSGYAQGADNLHINLTNTGLLFYNLIVNWMKNATAITGLEIAFLASGMAVHVLLAAGRYFFYWWPLNPIGFVVGASGPVRTSVFSIFTAWLVQTILLRIGGVNLYRRVQPLFLGILVGYILGVGLSYGIDTLWFPDTPHVGELF